MGGVGELKKVENKPRSCILDPLQRSNDKGQNKHLRSDKEMNSFKPFISFAQLHDAFMQSDIQLMTYRQEIIEGLDICGSLVMLRFQLMTL